MRAYKAKNLIMPVIIQVVEIAIPKRKELLEQVIESCLRTSMFSQAFLYREQVIADKESLKGHLSKG